MPQVPSQRAEDAAALLLRTLGSHRTQISRMAPARASRLSVPRHDPQQVAHQATLIRFASITEAFCAGALLEAAEKLAQPSATATMQAVWEESAISATRTWKDQQAAYTNWLDVKIKWEIVDGVADARNAVAHGLGSLTRQQVRKEAAVRSRLAKVGISPVGREVVLSDPTLQGIASKCRDFIFELDKQIQARLTKP